MKSEDVKREDVSLQREGVQRDPAGRARRVAWFAILLLTFHVSLVTTASAAPTQEDVFRSISDNVNESAGGGKILAVAAGGVAVVLLLAVLQQRKTRVERPRKVTHPGRLAKEIMRTVPLKAAELKQLKLLVERRRDTPEQRGEVRVENPLTLILCPSVLVKAMKNPPAKVDRKVIAQLARKLGAAPTATPARAR